MGKAEVRPEYQGCDGEGGTSIMGKGADERRVS